jgi:uncharacterized membrane protein (Fun14 family)
MSDLLGKITGNLGGVPTLVIMAIPLVIGLIVGYLVKKFLKFAIIAAIIVVVVAYFGFFGLSFTVLKNLADQYGPLAIQEAILLFGMLPLGIGFIIGVIIGFIVG